MSRKRFFQKLHDSIPPSSKKARDIARQQIIGEEFKGQVPINVNDIIHLSWFAESILKYVRDPKQVVDIFSKSKYLILHALDSRDIWTKILWTEFGLRPHDPSTIIHPTRPGPVVLLQMKTNGSNYNVYELNKNIPISRVCNMDRSNDHPFVKILTLRGYKQVTGNMNAIIKKTIPGPFIYGRRLTNTEKSITATLGTLLNDNGVVFFEQYGYTVNSNGVLEKASNDKIKEFSNSLKKWKRSLSNLRYYVCGDNKIHRESHLKDIEKYSDIITYTINECLRREWITAIYSKSILELHQQSYIERSPDIFISNILSQILPDELKQLINSSFATSWLHKKSKYPSFTVETLKCLIDAGAILSSEFHYNQRTLITDVIKANNVSVFNHLMDIGVGDNVETYPDYLKKSITKFLNRNF